MSAFPTLDNVDLKNKRVLVRVDLNVPMSNGRITDDTRIDRILPNIREISEKGGKVILLSHLGRPKGAPDPTTSLKSVAVELERQLGCIVAFASDCIGDVAKAAVGALQPGNILLLENTRFHKGETKNDPEFVRALAELGDIYVNDAFSTSHRAHASTEGLAHILPAYAGRTMQLELDMLTSMLAQPKRPLAALVGGAKVSTKLELLGNLMRKVEYLFIGGGMANTFLAASGKAIGKSLCEMELADVARKIMADAEAAKCELILPCDAMVAQQLAPGVKVRAVDIDSVGENDMILDIGPRTISKVVGLLSASRTLVWNGPFGAFEVSPFDAGTVTVARVAALLTKVSALETIAGGGDTIAALNLADPSARLPMSRRQAARFSNGSKAKASPVSKHCKTAFLELRLNKSHSRDTESSWTIIERCSSKARLTIFRRQATQLRELFRHRGVSIKHVLAARRSVWL